MGVDLESAGDWRGGNWDRSSGGEGEGRWELDHNVSIRSETLGANHILHSDSSPSSLNSIARSNQLQSIVDNLRWEYIGSSDYILD